MAWADLHRASADDHLAAKRAGFGNAETYRQAKSVTAHGAPELVEAMDERRMNAT